MVVGPGGEAEGGVERAMRVDLQEGYPLSVVGNFLKFHDFVVVVDGLIVEGMGQQIDDMFVDVADVEDFCYLDIQDVSILLLPPLHLFIYQMNLNVLLLRQLHETFTKTFLHDLVFFVDPLPPLSNKLSVLLDCPATHCPAIDSVGYLFLGQVLEEYLPLDVELHRADDVVKSKTIFLMESPDLLEAPEVVSLIKTTDAIKELALGEFVGSCDVSEHFGDVDISNLNGIAPHYLS